MAIFTETPPIKKSYRKVWPLFGNSAQRFLAKLDNLPTLKRCERYSWRSAGVIYIKYMVLFMIAGMISGVREIDPKKG